jgi:hypothetical protein
MKPRIAIAQAMSIESPRSRRIARDSAASWVALGGIPRGSEEMGKDQQTLGQTGLFQERRRRLYRRPGAASSSAIGNPSSGRRGAPLRAHSARRVRRQHAAFGPSVLRSTMERRSSG